MEKECFSCCEEWRKVNWTAQDFYEISNYGHCRSLDHYGLSRHRKGLNRLFKGGLLKPIIDKRHGRVRYRFSDHSRYQASILVARAFPEICGEWFEGCEVHHKDFNLSNNRADNLMVLTPEEHVSLHEIAGKWIRSNEPRHKSVEQKDLEDNVLEIYESISDAARAVNGTPGGICACCKGDQLSAFGYKWSYASSDSPSSGE